MRRGFASGPIRVVRPASASCAHRNPGLPSIVAEHSLHALLCTKSARRARIAVTADSDDRVEQRQPVLVGHLVFLHARFLARRRARDGQGRRAFVHASDQPPPARVRNRGTAASSCSGKSSRTWAPRDSQRPIAAVTMASATASMNRSSTFSCRFTANAACGASATPLLSASIARISRSARSSVSPVRNGPARPTSRAAGAP